MSDMRRAVLLRSAASMGALFVFMFSTWIVVQALTSSGSMSGTQTVAAYVVGGVISGSIIAAIWLTWWSAYRNAWD